MAEWQQTYDPRDLNYLSRNAKQIRDTASLLGVPALGLVGGVAREMAYGRNVDPYDPLDIVSSPMKDFFTSNEYDSSIPDRPAWKPITHQTLADAFARSNLPGGGIDPGAGKPKLAWLKVRNPVLWDVGPGHINFRTALTMLQNYNRMFPDSDPLGLKQYNQRYDLLMRDLKIPDNDATIKIAGLVARDGQDFYRKAMTPERWAMLSEDQRAAALTQYYVTGPERMTQHFQQSGGDPNTYVPDLNRDGSNTYLYDPGNGSWSNPPLLKNALSPGLRTENSPETPSASQAYAGLGASEGSDGQPVPAQSLSWRGQPAPAGLPPQVVANANYLSANGFAITPRSMYVAHVIGPQRAVDLFRTGSTGSPDIPSPDAATGDQVRAWVRALRSDELMPPAGNAVSLPPGASAGTNAPIGGTGDDPNSLFQ
ncbi:MAG: hypothetical protein JO084_15515 [Bradyrhizobiaceae bacterium]|nr:hypothetical protein [Bradyrhizobiaceae bacterium]